MFGFPPKYKSSSDVSADIELLVGIGNEEEKEEEKNDDDDDDEEEDDDDGGSSVNAAAKDSGLLLSADIILTSASLCFESGMKPSANWIIFDDIRCGRRSGLIKYSTTSNRR